jgi:hypothetical protein
VVRGAATAADPKGSSLRREARTVHVLGRWLALGHAHSVGTAIWRTGLDLIASVGHD